MTCEDCLSALSIESLREMNPDSALMLHCATCVDCARVTAMLREKEYETATLLNGLPPMSNPLTVAEAAVRTSQRRRVGRAVVWLSGAAGTVIIWMVAATTIIPALDRADMRTAGAQRTETMPLTCLSPQQAADIINPYIRTHGSLYYLPSSGISAITVRGTAEELAKSRNLIRDFEKDPSAACRAPTTMLRQLNKQLSDLQGQTGSEPVLAPGQSAEGTLLGKPGEPVFHLKGPSGSGPVGPPAEVPTTPKKR